MRIARVAVVEGVSCSSQSWAIIRIARSLGGQPLASVDTLQIQIDSLLTSPSEQVVADMMDLARRWSLGMLHGVLTGGALSPPPAART